MDNLNHRRAATYANIYTNNVRISYSTYDLALVCSQNDTDAEGALVVEEHAKISMSLEHAKRLSALLAQTINQIEEKLGSIPDFEAVARRLHRVAERGQ